MKFTQIPADTFSTLQLNAGVLVNSFTPSKPTIDTSAIVCGTSGGMKFTATPTYTDLGEDIDNCPANMKELKRLDSIEVKLSGTAVTLKASTIKQFVGAADIDSADATHIVPRADLTEADFEDIWFVGDYSDKNGTKNGGFIAIHLMNALNTAGFSLTTDNKKKGTSDFEFTAHYSMSDPTKVPFDIYVKAGTAETEA